MYEDTISQSCLLLRIKILKDRVNVLENGDEIKRLKEQHKRARQADFRTMRRLETELAESRREATRIRDMWFEVCLDVRKECDKELAQKDRELEKLREELEKEREASKKEREKKRDKTRELYSVKTELEEEKEKNLALNARINKNHTNSSKPSSSDPNHATIHNSREKTGKKPGGQPGHDHHPRKRHEATCKVEIPAPEKFLDTDVYKPTGNTVTKQLIIAHVVTEVIDYSTPEFRNIKTGQRVHAALPEGVRDDVNYDGTVRALAYMLNNSCNVSVDRTRTFLMDVSKGKISISNGMICNLSKQFSEKTKEEREQIFEDLRTAPVLHSDFTFGRVNGKQGAVIITATPEGKILYQSRTKKGDEGVKGSPLEFYEGTVVSDHESAIIKHGKRNQECLAHISRYMQGSIENEPDVRWSGEMLAWIKKSIHCWNRWHEGAEKYSKSKVRELIKEYGEILDKAKSEYEYEPPSTYYKDGFNTFLRMFENKEDYLLFLRDPSVPPTNNLAERSGRRYKRKNAQVMSFRSQKGSEYFCDGLTIMETIKSEGGSLYDGITKRFNRVK